MARRDGSGKSAAGRARIVALDAKSGQGQLDVDGLRRRLDVVVHGDAVWVDDEGHVHGFTEPGPTARADDTAADGKVRAPMGGRVVSVAVAEGDRVERGATLAIIEAMKMEHRVVATCTGVVQTLGVASGAQVVARAIVAVITPD